MPCSRGLVPGDRVGVLLPNSRRTSGRLLRVGQGRPVRVRASNTRETLDNHRYKLADSGSRAVIHDDIAGLETEIQIGSAEFAAMFDYPNDSPCQVDRALDAPLRLGYTGGTTGKAKAVTLTTRGDRPELSAFLMDLVPDSFEPGNTFLHAAPIALCLGRVFPAGHRARRALAGDEEIRFRRIHRARESRAGQPHLPGADHAGHDPRTADARGRDIQAAKIPMALRPSHRSLLDRAEARFGRIFAQCYGQAESPMVITCLRPEDHDRVGSCGRPFAFS